VSLGINHAANRLDEAHFETIAEMLKARLGFVELRRTERAIWLGDLRDAASARA
jgi:hypothetical protein